MDPIALVASHTIISLVAIVTGFVVAFGLLSSRPQGALTLVFLATTALTSASGYLFARDHVLPSHIVGAIALVVLAVTVYALYPARLAGRWRAVYAIGIVISLWLNVFVLVAQAFLKIPALHALAPTGTESPFGIAQALVFILFAILAARVLKRFHRASAFA